MGNVGKNCCFRDEKTVDIAMDTEGKDDKEFTFKPITGWTPYESSD